MLRVIWFANIAVSWKARKAVVFRQEGFDGERVVEAKVDYLGSEANFASRAFELLVAWARDPSALQCRLENCFDSATVTAVQLHCLVKQILVLCNQVAWCSGLTRLLAGGETHILLRDCVSRGYV
ncbi:hypothetical protein TSUD_350130 [Trifolium subterraneum]|uniref:Uncharacterized protein n=1 Tax=Trifolium subterraneum TaxID=3900 RepID=A0A2Z6PEP1_TRISU|nr:hypothetical protein TSUD_350130 [Trifolium subterraneum]